MRNSASQDNSPFDDPAGYRSGFVSLTGRPNVGKSTFLNAVLGQKVSIVTPRTQTTRNRIVGIKTLDDAQIVFLDTPGIHRSRHSLGSAMVKEAMKALKEVDVVLLMVEPRPPDETDMHIIRTIKGIRKPAFLLINKTDKVKKPVLLPVIEEYRGRFDFEDIIPISAEKKDGLDITLRKLVPLLPLGPKYYPEDMFTDMAERFMAAEIIREKIILLTGEEVPHSVAISIAKWKEEPNGVIHISANIYVEKEGQKGIIIGNKGSLLKQIGTSARIEIERLLGTRAFLELWVKTRKKWRSDAATLRELGF